MVTAIEIGVYSIVFFVALATTGIAYAASRKFVRGEFKNFISWVVAASIAFTLGSMLNLFSVALSWTIYGSTFLIVAGFAFVLTSICFVRASLLLLELSKVFGFAALDKELEGLFAKGHETGKTPKVKKTRKR